MTRTMRHDAPTPLQLDGSLREDGEAPAVSTVALRAQLQRSEQYRTIADAARKAGDLPTARFWDAERVAAKPNYAALPPGMTRERLLELAGANAASIPTGRDRDAYLRGLLVDHLLRGLEHGARTPRADEAERIEAADGKREFDDDWNNRWKRPPRSAAMLADRAPTTLEEARARSATAARHDEQPADMAWGQEWRREPRSAAFVRDELREPLRGGGMAIADVMSDPFDTSDADEPLLELPRPAVATSPSVTVPSIGNFPGRVRDDRRHVDVDDQALAAIDAAGGRALVVDSIGDHTAGELRHDGERYTIRCEAAISREAGRVVEVRPRGAR